MVQQCGVMPAAIAVSACHLLRPTSREVYSWFTEGFDTVDLQEAQRLLQELA